MINFYLDPVGFENLRGLRVVILNTGQQSRSWSINPQSSKRNLEEMVRINHA